MDADLPPLDVIGRDLLAVPVWRRALSLVFPFTLPPLFFFFAMRGWWIPALACPVVLSFVALWVRLSFGPTLTGLAKPASEKAYW